MYLTLSSLTCVMGPERPNHNPIMGEKKSCDTDFTYYKLQSLKQVDNMKG